jgi:hypothetical protein
MQRISRAERRRSSRELAKRPQWGTLEEFTRSGRLAFLAPEIVEAITAGDQPPELTAEVLAERIDLLCSGLRKQKPWGSPRRITLDHFLTISAKPVVESIPSCVLYGWNRLTCQQRLGRVLRPNRRKVVFSGAARNANQAYGKTYPPSILLGPRRFVRTSHSLVLFPCEQFRHRGRVTAQMIGPRIRRAPSKPTAG